MYDYWKPRFCQIVNGDYTEVIFTGSLGGGKSQMGELLFFRRIYELTCYENPLALFGMSGISQIVFMYLSVSMTSAERTGFGRLLRLIDDSPYMQENYPRDTQINSSLKFKRTDSIVGYAGSDIPHFIGMNLFGIILDEGNFLKAAGGDVGAFHKATQIYRESTNRRKGRFTVDNREHGISIVISSADTENSFTESRISEAKKSPEKIYYSVSTILEIKKDEFSKEVFYVMPGLDDFDPFVLCPDNKELADRFYKLSGVPVEQFSYDVPPDAVKDSFVSIPVNFRESFDVDVANSLKEVAGISIKKRMRLFYSKTNWNACIDPQLTHPFRAFQFTVSTSEARNELIEMFLPEVIKFSRDHLYFAHIDQSLSGDSTGISLAHPVLASAGLITNITLDFILRITAPRDSSSQIDISKIRDFYLWLIETYKLRLAKVTYDQYASAESIQMFKKKRVEADRLSVDRDDTQYVQFVHMLNKHQIRMYNYEPFRHEFFNLRHFMDKRKVDHDPGYSKDVSDSVVGSAFHCAESVVTSYANISKRDNMAAFLEINKSGLKDPESLDLLKDEQGRDIFIFPETDEALRADKYVDPFKKFYTDEETDRSPWHIREDD